MNSEGIQSYIPMYPLSPKLSSHPGCHISLSRVPCAIQRVFIGYPFQIQQWICTLLRSLSFLIVLLFLLQRQPLHPPPKPKDKLFPSWPCLQIHVRTLSSYVTLIKSISLRLSFILCKTGENELP